jgi:hypothetical protein
MARLLSSLRKDGRLDNSYIDRWGVYTWPIKAHFYPKGDDISLDGVRGIFIRHRSRF